MGATSSDKRSASVNGSHDFGRQYSEVNIALSDFHLSQGEQVELVYGGRTGLARLGRAILYRVFGRGQREETVPNSLEEFHYDVECAEFLRLTAERFREAKVLRFRFLGDIFDPLAVVWQGRYKDPPYEDVAVAKLQTIVDGHQELFSALREVLQQPNCRFDFFVGNHDLFLCWPEVQQLLLKVLTDHEPELSERVRFIDHRQDFRLIERNVLYEHGNFEPHNSVRPKKVFIKSVLGQRLKRPLLNTPDGNHMFVKMVTHLKNSNPLVGRVRSDRRVWNHALRHRWAWGVEAGVRLLAYFLSRLFAVADIRRKASLRKLLDIVAWTTGNQSVDEYMEQQLQENAKVQVVVSGHSHKACRMTGSDGTILNVGNWSRSYRLAEPRFELKWQRWRQVEIAWHTLQYFFVTGEVKFAWQMTKFVGALALLVAMTTFLLGAFDGGAWTFWPLRPLVAKVLVGIALVFTSAAGIFRLFSAEPLVTPDTRFTFGLIRFRYGGELKADLMQYDAETKTVHECV